MKKGNIFKKHLFIIYYLLFIIYYLLFIIYYLLFIIYYLLTINFYLKIPHLNTSIKIFGICPTVIVLTTTT
ncbi:hypothetical protein F0A81_04890 [Salmonella enterica]|nr:hypothetical protein [Salmonella enterica]ECQ3862932.1 hypothetical protein [Salmonella enterica]EEN6257758.1 hypothetical protein [Salmonella enterica]